MWGLVLDRQKNTKKNPTKLLQEPAMVRNLPENRCQNAGIEN